MAIKFTETELSVLIMLTIHRPGLSVKELSAMMGINELDTANICRKLISDGLVESK